MEEIEISSLDLRYSGCRMRLAHSEKQLLSSIREIGIRDPLLGVTGDGKRILLDGFKRYRCAVSLNITVVPYHSLSGTEAQGIVELLRVSNTKSLTLLEQAMLIEQLRTVLHMSATDISNQLEKSKAWVSVRTGVITEMGDFISARILGGKFPMYAYMYILRPFIRINKIPKEEIDEFVGLVSGKHLSIRDIDLLAHGYFKGSEAFREQFRKGNILWGLDRLKETVSKTSDCSQFEQSMLKDLEIIQKYMKRTICKSLDKRLQSASFCAMANLLSESILENSGRFHARIKDLYDKTRQA